jgi:hypothetical protein
MNLKQTIRRILNENTFQEALLKSIKKNGVLKVTKNLGLTTISETLDLTPIEFIKEYFTNVVFSTNDLTVNTYVGTYDFKFIIKDIEPMYHYNNYLFIFDIIEGEITIDDITYDLYGEEVSKINDEYDGVISAEITDILANFLIQITPRNSFMFNIKVNYLE